MADQTTTPVDTTTPIAPAEPMRSVDMPAPQVGSTGRITSVNISEHKGTRKHPVESGTIELDSDYGVHGDAHAGNWHRQVSFLMEESIDVAKDRGLDVAEGDFGENITVEGINMKGMPLGSRLAVGDAEVEISRRSARSVTTAAPSSTWPATASSRARACSAGSPSPVRCMWATRCACSRSVKAKCTISSPTPRSEKTASKT